MGIYINFNSKGKKLPNRCLKTLIKDGAKIISIENINDYKFKNIICIIENASFDAILIVDSQEQLKILLDDDSERNKTFLLYENANKICAGEQRRKGNKILNLIKDLIFRLKFRKLLKQCK